MIKTTLWDLLAERACLTPERIAHQVDDRSLSYAQWHLLAVKRADELASHIHRQERVVLEFTREEFLAYAVDYLAVLRLGATAVPLSAETDTSAQVRDQIIRLSGASTVLKKGEVCVVSQGFMPNFEDEEAPAEIIFTSGTTGEPKGWACSMEEICHEWDMEMVSPADRRIDLHGAAFGTNFIQEMLRSPVLWGSHVVTATRSSGQAIISAAKDSGANTLRLTPTIAHALVRAAGSSVLDQIEDISVSSAYSSPELLGQLQAVAPGARIVNQYSLTESGRAKLKSIWGESPAGALGRPVEGTEVRVVDEAGLELPTATTGELQLRHLTAPARRNIEQDPSAADWISTGDLGYLSNDGYVYLVGRSRDLIHVGGLKVPPLVVERALLQEPGIIDACVVGYPHPTLGEVPVAAVQLDFGASLKEIDLNALPPHEHPVRYRIVDEVPKNAAGKPLRSAVQGLFADTPTTTSQGEFDRFERIHESLFQVVREVLESDDIDITLSWYGAGGDSLTAVELMTIMEEEHGVDLPVFLFGPEASIADIFYYVDAIGKRS